MENKNMPAFPVLEEGNISPGMSKRELIATHMMQGLLASWGQHDVTNYDEFASDAVMATDALLYELSKPAKP